MPDAAFHLLSDVGLPPFFLMEVRILVFLALLVRSPFALFFLESLFWSVLSLTCLTRGLDRCPHERFSCSSRGTLARACKLAHLSQAVPLGYRFLQRWVMAAAPATRVRKNKSFLIEFLQFLDASRAKEASPGAGRCAPHEAETTSDTSS